jgi:hypothetical protein
VEAPRHVLLPANSLAFGFDVLGASARKKGSHAVLARVESADGTPQAEGKQDLAEPQRMTLPLKNVKPSDYTLRVKIQDAAGKLCSESAQPIYEPANTSAFSCTHQPNGGRRRGFRRAAAV